MAQGGGSTGIYDALNELLAKRTEESRYKQAMQEKLAQQALENQLRERQAKAAEQTAGFNQGVQRIGLMSPNQTISPQEAASREQFGLGDTMRKPQQLEGIPQFSGTLDENRIEGAPQTRNIGTFSQQQAIAVAKAQEDRANEDRARLAFQSAESLKRQTLSDEERGRHNRVMEARPTGAQERPYYTMQPIYDPQGRPKGAYVFDTRTGQIVETKGDVGGGQMKPPPGDLGKQTIVNEASAAALDNLENLFNAGGKDVIGPAEGRARSIGQKLPLVPVNKQFSDFEAASAAFRNSVIKAITGAQMSEPEADRIRQQIPDVNDKPEVWQSKAAQTRKNLALLEQAIKVDRDTQPAATAGPRRVRYDMNGKPIQ